MFHLFQPFALLNEGYRHKGAVGGSIGGVAGVACRADGDGGTQKAQCHSLRRTVCMQAGCFLGLDGCYVDRIGMKVESERLLRAAIVS